MAKPEKKPKNAGRIIPKVRPALTDDEFLAWGKPLVVTIHEEGSDSKTVLMLVARRFASGGFGWHGQEKATFPVGNVAVRVQIGVNVNVIGSKLSVEERRESERKDAEASSTKESGS